VRIAQISPLYESVPPKLYGGTERVVSYLTEELVQQGHEVTLFASGDSQTRGRLIVGCRQALRLEGRFSVGDSLPMHVALVELVRRHLGEFDVAHFHIDGVHYPMLAAQATPHLTTVHGRVDRPETLALHRVCRAVPLAAISDAQRQSLPVANWQGTVHHGLPRRQFATTVAPHKGYLLFVGRVSEEKGVLRAIEIARRAELPLRIAAKVGEGDVAYYRQIEQYLRLPLVEFLGEVGDEAKAALMREAVALLFPIDWPEPFGLVMIEAMAQGTPVVAWPRGAVPEVIDEGVTGFVVSELEAAVAAVRRAESLDRARVRDKAWQRFSVERMARDYLRLYELQIERRDATTRRG
jgi:glycosyltransferase involved in cell wall biosynthesis